MSGGPGRGGLAAQCRPEQAMNWRRWLAALFVVLALAGCAPWSPCRDRRQKRPISKAILATSAVCTDQVAGGSAC